MQRSWRLALQVACAAAGVLAVAACDSGTAILVQVNSERSIPDEVNVLDMVAYDADGNPGVDPELGGREFALREGDAFPLVVRFEPEEGTPTNIFLQVTLRLGAVPVEGIAVEHDWQPDRITWVPLPAMEPL